MNFHDAIYLQLAHIPYGHVTSYGALAKKAGFPNHSRHVGNLLKKLPNDSTLPWFRVVNSQRKISFPENSPAYKRQKEKLEAEGIIFLKGRILPEFFVD